MTVRANTTTTITQEMHLAHEALTALTHAQLARLVVLRSCPALEQHLDTKTAGAGRLDARVSDAGSSSQRNTGSGTSRRCRREATCQSGSARWQVLCSRITSLEWPGRFKGGQS